MSNLAPTYLALLKHLGIHVYDSWEVGPWGDPVDCLHVFAPRQLVDEVSSFFMSAGQHYPARVFEGPPPPF